ncbi:MAG: hypothetical protein NTY47_07125, partial [Candidatus Omnitrophica bacterium]|nr:hypothetical protein [Candidatus Omnitrophota bacterium]
YMRDRFEDDKKIAKQEIGRTMEIMSKDGPVDMGIAIELFNNEVLAASVFHHEWLHSTGVLSEGETLLRQSNYTRAAIAEEALALTEEERVRLESEIASTMRNIRASSLGYYFVADQDDKYLARLNRNILDLYGPDGMTEHQIQLEVEKVLSSINEMIELANLMLREKQKLDPSISLYSPLSDENKKLIIELVRKTREIKNTLTPEKFREILIEEQQYQSRWIEYRKSGGGQTIRRVFDLQELISESGVNETSQKTEREMACERYNLSDDGLKILGIKPTDPGRNGSTTMHFVDPFTTLAVASGAIMALSWLKDLAFAHPVSVGIIVVGVFTVLYIIWRKCFPVDFWISRLKRGDPEKASRALTIIGAPAVPRLIKLLRSLNKDNVFAARILGNIRDNYFMMTSSGMSVQALQRP